MGVVVRELCISCGELAVPRVEPIFDSVIKTYYKLQELGFIEIGDQVGYNSNTETNHDRQIKLL